MKPRKKRHNSNFAKLSRKNRNLNLIIVEFDLTAVEEVVYVSLVGRQTRIGRALEASPLRRAERLVEVRQRLVGGLFGGVVDLRPRRRLRTEQR